ncbi:DUF1963 domain-containing protein [Kitasatospora terrestris]|uniref:DUF1963 domain-containing protein n=1 Tax=Kitasatospora terrestris TaxID=258051 RepID=A0ABP9EBR1_9ACTN
MTTLMTYAGAAAPDALQTRTGGIPLAPPGTAWPHCATCTGPMQFLAHVLLDDLGHHAGQGATGGRGLLALFMCQNDPGMCAEWNPTSGGNQALIFPTTGLQPIPVPTLDTENEDEDTVLLGEVSAVTFEPPTPADYDQAHKEWRTTHTSRSPMEILGQLGGHPTWLQYDETPACPTCTEAMTLVTQLEEGCTHTTGMNFGGRGKAYAFACEPCARARFLWQC